MTDFQVIEVGFFIRPMHDALDHALGALTPEGLSPNCEYRVWGRVLIQAGAVDDHGAMWLQQAVVEGRLDWGLYDWPVVREREAIFPASQGEMTWADWSEPDDEPGRPLTSADRRNVVALALHRARGIIADVNTARL